MISELKKYIDERFDRLEATALIGVKTLLTAEEAARYIGYAMKGLYELTYRKRIPHYKKNGKLYFKKSELDEWLTHDRVATVDEMNSRATTYLVTGRLSGKR